MSKLIDLLTNYYNFTRIFLKMIIYPKTEKNNKLSLFKIIFKIIFRRSHFITNINPKKEYYTFTFYVFVLHSMFCRYCVITLKLKIIEIA